MFLDVSRVHSATVELLQAKKDKKRKLSGHKRAIVEREQAVEHLLRIQVHVALINFHVNLVFTQN